MTDLTTLTPVEIDTFLSSNWGEQAKYRGFALSEVRIIDSPSRHWSERNRVEAQERLDGYKAQIAALVAEAAPYQAEYYRRGGWSRYFLVTNVNGHVHRGMDCKTCFTLTEYSWVVDLADCDESKMVEEFGEKACTVCFPDAPANPSFAGPGRRDAAAKALRDVIKAERDAIKAAKNLTPEQCFRDARDWKVTTLAGAKQALRDAVGYQVVAGTTADYNNYATRILERAVEVFNTASAVLAAKGVTEYEIAKIVANATKRTRKECNL